MSNGEESGKWVWGDELPVEGSPEEELEKLLKKGDIEAKDEEKLIEIISVFLEKFTAFENTGDSTKGSMRLAHDLITTATEELLECITEPSNHGLILTYLYYFQTNLSSLLAYREEEQMLTRLYGNISDVIKSINKYEEEKGSEIQKYDDSVSKNIKWILFHEEGDSVK